MWVISRCVIKLLTQEWWDYWCWYLYLFLYDSSTPADLGHSFASCTGRGSCLAGSLQGQSHCPLVPPTSSPIHGRAAEHPWVSPCCSAHEDGEGQGEHSLPGSSPSLLLGAWPSNSCWLKKQTNPTWARRGQGHWERTALHPRSCLMKREMPHQHRCLKLEGNLASCLVSAFLLKSPQKHVVCYFSILVWRGWSQLVQIVTINWIALSKIQNFFLEQSFLLLAKLLLDPEPFKRRVIWLFDSHHKHLTNKEVGGVRPNYVSSWTSCFTFQCHHSLFNHMERIKMILSRLLLPENKENDW